LVTDAMSPEATPEGKGTDMGATQEAPPQQRVAHFLYEGEVEVWTADDPEDGQAYIILRDGPHDLGDDLGDYLAWLLGPGRADGTGRCKLAKRLRLIVDDLDADGQAPERRAAEGDPPNLEMLEVIRSASEVHRHASAEVLAGMRDQWRDLYRDAIGKARAAYFQAAAYELLTAQADRQAAE
jgi:hypothetical protein